MNKKSLKKMVKNYFSDNNRMMGIFAFVFLMMFLMSTLLFGGSGIGSSVAIIVSFLLMLIFIYWKVWYVTTIAYRDIKKDRIIKKNVRFKTLKEDKSWIFWNSNPKNSAVCKYIATDDEGNEYRLCTTCSYQNVKAVEKFLSSHNFRIVQLEKSKLIICIQYNPADIKDKKEKQEVLENTKALFSVFSYAFTYKND